MGEMMLPPWFGPFQARPRLVGAFVIGLAVGCACAWIVGLQPSTSAILGWDVLCLVFIAAAMLMMRRRSPDEIRAHAALEDEGRLTILTLVITAAVAAIVAVGLELSLARQVRGLERSVRIALAFGTLAASWFMTHLIFALHYAHGYYDQEGGGDAGGLRFPGGEEPDYWDFLHFAVIIGVAAQTADIAISAPRLRRLNTVHALFSFAFNTVVVALTINLLAGLFG
jgi:uncharacterized membrane protein